VNDQESKADPTTVDYEDHEVTGQKHQIPRLIGVGGDYTIHTHSFRKAVPMPDFGHIVNKEQNDMKKIYRGRAYNHSKFIRLEHTETLISTICQQFPSENMTRVREVFDSIPLYVEQNVIVTNAMIDQGHQLAYLLNGLATHVFKISKETIHLFRDIDGGKCRKFFSFIFFDNFIV